MTTFLDTITHHGTPASTLTDNGRVYTARFGGGRNAFEYLLPILGVTQKNGPPGHPQTQGKIERFHHTQKRYLAAQPTARTLDELQEQLDNLREYHNDKRPHRARGRDTPGHAYRATPKALPATPRPADEYRVRYDHVDPHGKMSLRRAGRMHHLGIGIEHAHKRVIAIADTTTVTVIHLDTGDIIATNTIQPDKTYWRNTKKAPDRWPGASQ